MPDPGTHFGWTTDNARLWVLPDLPCLEAGGWEVWLEQGESLLAASAAKPNPLNIFSLRAGAYLYRAFGPEAAAAFGPAELVVIRMAAGLHQGAGAHIRSTDAQYHHAVDRITQPRSRG